MNYSDSQFVDFWYQFVLGLIKYSYSLFRFEETYFPKEQWSWFEEGICRESSLSTSTLHRLWMEGGILFGR